MVPSHTIHYLLHTFTCPTPHCLHYLQHGYHYLPYTWFFPSLGSSSFIPTAPFMLRFLPACLRFLIYPYTFIAYPTFALTPRAACNLLVLPCLTRVVPATTRGYLRFTCPTFHSPARAAPFALPPFTRRYYRITAAAFATFATLRLYPHCCTCTLPIRYGYLPTCIYLHAYVRVRLFYHIATPRLRSCYALCTLVCAHTHTFAFCVLLVYATAHILRVRTFIVGLRFFTHYAYIWFTLLRRYALPFYHRVAYIFGVGSYATSYIPSCGTRFALPVAFLFALFAFAFAFGFTHIHGLLFIFVSLHIPLPHHSSFTLFSLFLLTHTVYLFVYLLHCPHPLPFTHTFQDRFTFALVTFPSYLTFPHLWFFLFAFPFTHFTFAFVVTPYILHLPPHLCLTPFTRTTHLVIYHAFVPPQRGWLRKNALPFRPLPVIYHALPTCLTFTHTDSRAAYRLATCRCPHLHLWLFYTLPPGFFPRTFLPAAHAYFAGGSYTAPRTHRIFTAILPAFSGTRCIYTYLPMPYGCNTPCPYIRTFTLLRRSLLPRHVLAFIHTPRICYVYRYASSLPYIAFTLPLRIRYYVHYHILFTIHTRSLFVIDAAAFVHIAFALVYTSATLLFVQQPCRF